MSNIQAVIFDLGGVLLNIDYSKTVKAFEKLGIVNPEREFSKQHQSKLFRDLEKGQIGTEEFVARIQEITGIKESEPILEAWCALLGAFEPSTYILLEDLKANGVPLYILSNTNEIHQQQFESHIEQNYGWSKFLSLFDRIHYSHILKMRKPDAEIFGTVLALHNLAASSTLFIDDTGEHVHTAKLLGLQTHHLQEGEVLREIIKKFGLLR